MKDNPLSSSDFAILSQSGKEIFNYLNNQEHRLKLNEVKVIILGNSGVGKSTFVNFYENSVFKSLDSTHGIEIKRVKVKSDFADGRMIDDNEFVYINFFDFAGQDYYHSTYKLFLGDVITIVAFVSKDLKYMVDGDLIEESVISNDKVVNKSQSYNHKNHHPQFWIDVVTESMGNSTKQNIILLETKKSTYLDDNLSPEHEEFFRNIYPEYLKNTNYHIKISSLEVGNEDTKALCSKNMSKLVKAIYEKTIENNTLTHPESWINTINYIREERGERLGGDNAKFLLGKEIYDVFKINYKEANKTKDFNFSDFISDYKSMLKLIHTEGLVYILDVNAVDLGSETLKIYIDPNDFIKSIYDILVTDVIIAKDCIIDRAYIESVCTKEKCGYGPISNGNESDSQKAANIQNYNDYIDTFINKMISINTIYLINSTEIDEKKKKYFVPQFLLPNEGIIKDKLDSMGKIINEDGVEIKIKINTYSIRIKKALYTPIWNNLLGELNSKSVNISDIYINHSGIEFKYKPNYKFIITHGKQKDLDENGKYSPGLIIYTNCMDEKVVAEILIIIHLSIEKLKYNNDVLYVSTPSNINYVRLIDYLKPCNDPRLWDSEANISNKIYNIENNANFQLGNNTNVDCI